MGKLIISSTFEREYPLREDRKSKRGDEFYVKKRLQLSIKRIAGQFRMSNPMLYKYTLSG
jgi:hypothetical protein